MRKYVILLLLGGMWGIFACSGGKDVHLSRETVIPKPQVVVKGEGRFVFTPQTVWQVENEEQAEIAGQITRLFKQAAGFDMSVKRTVEASGKGVFFETDQSLAGEEAYHLAITPEEVRVKASGRPGFFYAMQTLRQMLPPAIEAQKRQEGVEWSVPVVEITDAPRFGYRGFMLDVSRFFVPKERVLKLIDYMGMLKMNKFHFHLVDDNGWRLEIKKYPELTRVGAWRVERKEEFPARRGPKPGEPTPVGGFYTHEDIREIVGYAASKSIEVIPEIEMPAHTTSSIAAYPWLACSAEDQFVGVLPGFGGFSPVYCAGNEKVFEFLEGVMDEVVELFPSKYIHIGGDEATKEYWKKCPKCQARMKAEKIPHEEELQGYFMQRINQYIRSKGKTAIGWDELTNSTLPEGAVIMGWRGLGNAAFKAAKQGHSYILAPARIMYLIRYQGPQWFEPLTYFGNNTLADVYHYEPGKQTGDTAVLNKLLGLQACMWCEFMHSPEEVEYMVFPRLTALAERAWCSPEVQDWGNYLKRLDGLLEHYDYLGINYARSMFNLDHQVRSCKGELEVTLSCVRPDVEIRYTLDGTEPAGTSPIYDSLSVSGNTVVKAATFRAGKQLGETLVLNLNFNKATAKIIHGGNPDLALLVNGLKGSEKQSDFEWCGWYGKDGEFVVDLGTVQPVNRIALGAIRRDGMGVFFPESLTFSVSEDGKEYTEIASGKYSLSTIFEEGSSVAKLEFPDLKAKGRYLKVKFRNPGVCPADHPRKGQPTWVYFDEIEVE